MTGQQRRRLDDAMARTTPLRLAVHGLPGVGSSAVAWALGALARFEVVAQQPDVTVRVVAEVVKPEDVTAVAEAAGPVLVVHTKADLCGFGPGGPVATARRRCVRLAGRAGVPTVPMVGLLARAALDPEVLDGPLMAGLGVLAEAPADLRTAETFVAGPHPLAAARRQELVDALDLFGIAHAVLALRDHPDSPLEAVRRVLHQVSGVDDVAASLEALGAQVRYHRVRALIAQWDALAVTDPEVAELLLSDEVVSARMAAAVDVLAAEGLAIDADGPAPDPRSAHLRRAVRWRRYGAGPVTALHHACAADVTRGSLRLWGADR